MFCFLQELFGWSNEKRIFVYLSDGGHFENLGIYELVRRRCGVIVVVDASADGEHTFDDLGRAIRQCRVDFGVEITLNLNILRKRPARSTTKGAYILDSVFRYRDFVGKLVYIKPSLTEAADEPEDVLAYARREPTFPHQTTGDPFVDESQFESFRRLGLHIGEKYLSGGGCDVLRD